MRLQLTRHTVQIIVSYEFSRRIQSQTIHRLHRHITQAVLNETGRGLIKKMTHVIRGNFFIIPYSKTEIYSREYCYVKQLKTLVSEPKIQVHKAFTVHLLIRRREHSVGLISVTQTTTTAVCMIHSTTHNNQHDSV